MTRSRRARQDQSRERGFVLILSSVAMFFVIVLAAMSVDLGNLRATRQNNQKEADLAALAAGFFLSGRGSVEVKPAPEMACEAAINTIQTDSTSFAPALTAAERKAVCAPFPETGFDRLEPDNEDCDAATAPITVTVERGPYTLSIRYPVPDSEITNGRFVAGLGVDDGDSLCQRMRIELDRTNATFFAGVFGPSTLSVSASAVVRGNTRVAGAGVAALMLLEREGCGTLQTSGGGSSGSGVVVEASSGTNPGVIQADSAGMVPPCSTNLNATGYVVYGTALPSASGGGPSIVAKPAANGAPGVIGIRAAGVGGRSGAVVGTGISPGPVAADIASRQPADDKYNAPVAIGGNAQITTLHATGWALATRTSAPFGYASISGTACSGLNTTAGNPYATAEKIFVRCDTFVPDIVDFPAAKEIVFTGKIDIANNKRLSMPNAQRIYVRGCVASCSSGNLFAIRVSGELRVNTGGDGTMATACSDRKGPGAGGTTTNWTAIATFRGPLLVSGQLRLCQTFVYLGNNESTYSRRSVTTTGSGTPSYSAFAACSVTLPCPSDSGGDGYIDMSGGSASADWSAPNQLSTTPTVFEFPTYPFEAISLWSETSSPSSIKGQGANRTEGVYFLPNSSVTFTGQAVQSLPLNAQFFSRRLNISGQGSLFLKPDENDAIRTRIAGAVSLIR